MHYTLADETKKTKPEGKEAAPQAKNELTECRKLRDEYLAGWQRARADFINYQKEERERIAGVIQFANEGLLLDLLLVLDSFDLAAAHAQSESERKSCELIQSQLMGILRKNGLEYVRAESGGQPDPTLHEVVGTVKNKDKPAGTIEEVISRGYSLHGKVIRAARVKIIE